MEASASCGSSAAAAAAATPVASFNFADRFRDIPEPLRSSMINACTEAAAADFWAKSDANRRLSIDDGGRVCQVSVEMLVAEAQNAMSMGFPVEKVLDRLFRLRAITAEYVRADDRLKARMTARKRLREQLEDLDAEVDRAFSCMFHCESEFKKVAKAPWKLVIEREQEILEG